MSISVDASTPARIEGSPNTFGTITTASFTAPANSFLVACLCGEITSTIGIASTQITDSSGLTWTKVVERDEPAPVGGDYCGIYIVSAPTSTARTVTFTRAGAGGGNAARFFSLKVYVLTGVDVAGTPYDTVSASNQNGHTGSPFTTTSLTPGATGLRIDAFTNNCASGTATCTSTDLTVDAGTSNVGSGDGNFCFASGYKACTSGVGVTSNLTAGGTGPLLDYVGIIVRQAAGGGGGGSGFAIADITSGGMADMSGGMYC